METKMRDLEWGPAHLREDAPQQATMQLLDGPDLPEDN